MAQASAEKLKHTGPAKKESVSKRTVGKYARAVLAKRKKEPSRLSKAPDLKRGESQGKREPHLGEKGRSERKHGEKRVDSTAKEGRFQGGKGGQAR